MAKPVTPLLTVDAVIEMIDRPDKPIVLIERRHEPLGWALPGGFVDVGETVEEACVREAAEETGLDAQIVKLLGCYSDPHRDPRGHTVSIVFVCEATGIPRASDDARDIMLAEPASPPPLAFDHAEILAHYRKYFREV